MPRPGFRVHLAFLHLSYHSLVTQVLLLNFLLLLVEEALISQRAVTVAFIFLSLDLAHEVCAPYVFVDWMDV